VGLEAGEARRLGEVVQVLEVGQIGGVLDQLLHVAAHAPLGTTDR
jgi:hypothetical protein